MNFIAPSFGEIAQIITAGVMILNCWQTWRVKKDVKIIELATNSMKDALVIATAKAASAEGHAEGLEQGRNETR